MAGHRAHPVGSDHGGLRPAHSAPGGHSRARTRLRITGAIALLLPLTVALACEQPGEAGDLRIDGQEAQRLVSSGAVLVDVRTEPEFRAGHLPDALHVPVSKLTERMDELPRDRTLIVYCQSGVRSARAAAELEREGFEVRDLGSIGDWPD